MRDQKTKEAFVKYLQDPKNKDLRFWQALSDFSKECIFFDTHNGDGTFTDTFYIEADEERENYDKLV